MNLVPEYTTTTTRSAEGRLNKREKYKQKKYRQKMGGQLAALKQQRAFDFEKRQINKKHPDEYCKEAWGGCLAFPVGLKSFVDMFDESSRNNDTYEVPQGMVVQMCDEAGDEIYCIEGKAIYLDGKMDPWKERTHIKNMGKVVSSNMAHKRGRSKPGYGDIWAAGLRYRYAEPKGGQKMGHVAAKKGCSAQYQSALQHVSKITNAAMRVVANWSDQDRWDTEQQMRLMGKICCRPGTAGFTHPIASGSLNGGFGAHWDGRDVRKTVWVALGNAALVFPSVEHTVYLEPGDVIRFDARYAMLFCLCCSTCSTFILLLVYRKYFHANTVLPDADDVATLLRSILRSQREQHYAYQQMQQAADEQRSGGDFVAGRPIASRGARIGNNREQGQRQRDADLQEANDLLRAHGGWMDQCIVCLYFQSQQQSYMVNSYNNSHDDTVHIDQQGRWAEEHDANAENRPEEEDPCDPHDMSEYELERESRIRRHNTVLQDLGLLRNQ